MLTGKKITLSAKTFVDDVEIASYGAVIDVETDDISFYTKQIGKPACRLNKEIVRADNAEFEDFAYAVQDSVKPASTESNE